MWPFFVEFILEWVGCVWEAKQVIFACASSARCIVCYLYQSENVLSRDQLEQLHTKAQDLLKAHAIGVKSSRQKQLHREALMARLEVDANLLLSKHS